MIENHFCASLPSPVTTSGLPTGKDLAIGLRPHDLVLAETLPGANARFNAKIHLTEPLGDVTIFDVAAEGAELKMVLREEVAARYSVGDELEIAFNPSDLHFFERASGRRLGGEMEAS